ncbi:MAG: ribonuclease R family protein [Verrucomicrobiales bacterium]
MPNTDLPRLIQDLLYEAGDHGYTSRRLWNELRPHSEIEFEAFIQLLQQLEKQSLVTQDKRRRWLGAQHGGQAQGLFSFTGRGLAFVQSQADGSMLAVIPRGEESVALPGDLVEIQVLAERKSSKKNVRQPRDRAPQAKITKILKRNREEVTGTVFSEHKQLWLDTGEVGMPALALDVPDQQTIEEGQKVRAKLLDWTNPKHPPRAEFIETLGLAGAYLVESQSILVRHGIIEEFSDVVEHQAQAATKLLKEAAQDPDREDWTDRPCLTIDPINARDHDDAVWVVQHSHGGWTAAVHIADVSAFVPSGSGLDKEARRRGNSIYLPDRAIPMLPHALSGIAASLVEGEERPAFSAILDFDQHGLCTKHRFVSTLVKIGCFYDYDTALKLLKKKPGKDDLLKTLQAAHRLTQTLRRRRFDHGAINLDFPELEIDLDHDGNPKHVAMRDSHEAHQLVEELMLAANVAAAKSIIQSGRPSLFRIHDRPDERRLEEFRQLLAEHSIRVGPLSSRKQISKALDQIKGSPEEAALKREFLRCMPRAMYSRKGTPHYGLNEGIYTHFTSPIRRYSDICVHRTLKNDSPRSSQREWDELATHLSQTEQTADGIEREVKMWALRDYVLRDENRDRVWRGIIVDSLSWAWVLSLPELGAEGVLKRRDGWKKHAKKQRDSKPPTYALGQELTVRLIDFDQAARRFVAEEIDPAA